MDNGMIARSPKRLHRFTDHRGPAVSSTLLGMRLAGVRGDGITYSHDISSRNRDRSTKIFL